YGVTRFQAKRFRVHRLAWTLFRSAIPKGSEICHHCDNPPCCNPNHLFAATHHENMRDASRKKRIPGRKGEDHNCAKLNKAQVLQIRKEYAEGGIIQRELAKKYGVAQGLVSMIVLRQIWRHI